MGKKMKYLLIPIVLPCGHVSIEVVKALSESETTYRNSLKNGLLGLVRSWLNYVPFLITLIIGILFLAVGKFIIERSW